MTHIEQTRVQHASVRQQVQTLLGWTDLQYAEYQEAQGRAYITHELAEASSEFVEEILRSKIYWSWWRIHWVERDREFLDMASMLWPHEAADYYRDLHTVDAVGFRPHQSVLAHSYMRMAHRLVKQATKPLMVDKP